MKQQNRLERISRLLIEKYLPEIADRYDFAPPAPQAAPKKASANTEDKKSEYKAAARKMTDERLAAQIKLMQNSALDADGKLQLKVLEFEASERDYLRWKDAYMAAQDIGGYRIAAQGLKCPEGYVGYKTTIRGGTMCRRKDLPASPAKDKAAAAAAAKDKAAAKRKAIIKRRIPVANMQQQILRLLGKGSLGRFRGLVAEADNEVTEKRYPRGADGKVGGKTMGALDDIADLADNLPSDIKNILQSGSKRNIIKNANKITQALKKIQTLRKGDTEADALKAYNSAVAELKDLKTKAASLRAKINKPKDQKDQNKPKDQKDQYEIAATPDMKIDLAGVESELEDTQEEVKAAAEKLRKVRMDKIKESKLPLKPLEIKHYANRNNKLFQHLIKKI